ncbi:hypothetical protein GCM10010498_58580 [Streptomyces cavourensis]|nr:hypothetical protein GCM10010498_58580 [Streptomyces cavourensis]
MAVGGDQGVQGGDGNLGGAGEDELHGWLTASRAKTYGDEQHTSLGSRVGQGPATPSRSLVRGGDPSRGGGDQGAHVRRARPVHMHIRPDSVTTYPARALVKGD